MSWSARDKHSAIAKLPYESLLQILTYMSYDGLAQCVRVCRLWSAVASDSSLWATVDLSKVRSKLFSDADVSSFICAQIVGNAKTIAVRNPYYLSGRDLSPLLSALGYAKRPTRSQLQTLKLENYQGLDCNALSFCLASPSIGHNLHTISLHGTHVDNTVIRALCQNKAICANLRQLDLSFCAIRSDNVRLIADTLQTLEGLSLSGNLAIEGEAIEYLLKKQGTHLSSLELRFIWGLHASWFVDYFNKSVEGGVKFLDIRGCEHFTRKDLRQLSGICPDAKVLSSVVLEDDSIEGYQQFLYMMATASIADDIPVSVDIVSDLPIMKNSSIWV
ncbi:hypothetical protein V1512DRAFT_209290 [Lipomyces arxii]|uniref:uncharacterized protein n=1 Tax=Lipomyces arxii TaxID=56418 RepID=UPI0034CEA1DF